MTIQEIIIQQQEKISSLYDKYCTDLDAYEETVNLNDADKSMKQLCNYLEQCCAINNSDNGI